MALFHIHKWSRWTRLFSDDPKYVKRECETCGLPQHKRIWTKGA